MLNSLIQSVFFIARKPGTLLIGFVFGLLSALMLEEIAIELANLSNRVIILRQLPVGDAFTQPFLFFARFTPETFYVLGLFALMTAFNVMMLYSFAAMIGKEMGAGKAFLEAVSKLKEIIGFIFFVYVIGMVAGLASYAIGIILGAAVIPGLVLGLAYLALIAYLYLKLMFTPIAMALQKTKLRTALQQSWKFSEKKFWRVIAFVFALSIALNAFNYIGLGLALSIEQEFLQLILVAIVVAIATTYGSVAVIQYYKLNQAK